MFISKAIYMSGAVGIIFVKVNTFPTHGMQNCIIAEVHYLQLLLITVHIVGNILKYCSLPQ